ncbi:MAG: hypothetical protein ACRELY_03800 [Polyangiaceae bacterium]
MSKKKILHAKEKEIAKAGRLMFDALFGEDGELEKNLEQEASDDERDSTARGSWVVDTVGHTLLRCDTCGRELVLVGSIDVAIAQAHGWRSHEDKWTCSTCTRKGG